MTLRAAWVPFVDSRRVASVRLRTYNPVDLLSRAGREARVLQRGEPASDEVLVLQKAYAPEHLEMARRHRSAGGAVVLDLCDNHFVHDDANPQLVSRAARLTALLGHVDVVSVCTDELGEVVPHPVVMAVNDALDPVPARPRLHRMTERLRRRPRVLWFGTAGAHDLPFGMRDLGRVLPELGRAARELPFELVVMSNSRAAFADLAKPDALRMRYLPWGAKRFAYAAAMSEVAVLPVQINEVTRGKTNNRVATSLLHGLSVVTDPLPSYLAFRDAVRMGDYDQHVLEYLRSPELRSEHLRLGREVVRRLYADDVIVDQWSRVLQEATRVRSQG